MDEKELQKLIERADIPGLLEVFTQLGTRARAETLEAISSRLSQQKKKAAVNRLKASVKETDGKVRSWLVNSLAATYLGALGFTSARLNESKPDEITGIHKEAVNALVGDAYADFAGGMNGVVRSAERQLNDALRRQVRAQIAAGELKGEAISDIADDVTELLNDQGFTALIDRGGRKWALTNYADMLAQTHVIQASNDATINRMAEFGVNIVEVSSHGATDTLCRPHEGKIYSISGNSDEYPQGPLPSYHPRCKHSILPRPDLA